MKRIGPMFLHELLAISLVTLASRSTILGKAAVSSMEGEVQCKILIKYLAACIRARGRGVAAKTWLHLAVSK